MIAKILKSLGITQYKAAKTIAESTGETQTTVERRLSRWVKGKPPTLPTIDRDLKVLGYEVIARPIEK